MQSRNDQSTHNYGGTFNVNGYLPWSITLGTDITYSGSAGYSAGYNTESWLWNAQASYQFLKGKNATIALKVYDILGQRNSIRRTVTGNYIQDVEYNTLDTYGLITFTYRFNTFGDKKPDMDRFDRGPRGVYFSSSTEKALGKNKSGITGTKNCDLFFSKKNERGAWQKPEPIEGDVNTEDDEGVISFSPDGTTMYLTKARREPNADTSVEIYTSTRTGAQWSAPQKYEITADTLSAFGHPAVSPDGEFLYFVSDMPGGYGGKDIWRISLTEKEGTLENLGVQINTPGDEMFPYIRSNGDLYFSSDGHPGMGGLDIFKAKMNDSGFWQIENMKAPINSQADDFGITFGEEESGFFSSNRGDGRGYDNIYSFELPSISVWISGTVIDKDDEPVPDAIIRIVGNDGSNQKEFARKDGSFRFKLDRGVHYVMLASCRGYLNSKQEFISDNEEADAEYGVNFVLASISKPILIENIFYDFDRATLRPESETSLNELVKMLNDNPNVSIELGAHTDLKGSEQYNLRLSDRRARSVVDYLIKSGINPDRLQPKGYGESRPKVITKKLATQYPQFKEGDVLDEKYINGLSPEDQEIANQINRRTEFQVLSITWNLY